MKHFHNRPTTARRSHFSNRQSTPRPTFCPPSRLQASNGLPLTGYDEFSSQARQIHASYLAIQRMEAPYSRTLTAFVAQCIDMYKCGWTPSLLTSSLDDVNNDDSSLFLESVALVWLTLGLLESEYSISTGRLVLPRLSGATPTGSPQVSAVADVPPLYMECRHCTWRRCEALQR